MLSQLLNSLVSHRGYVPFKVPLGCLIVTHLVYADDVIIFSSGMKRSLQLVIKTLEDNTLILGQKVNHHKSCFLTHASFLVVRKHIIV